jgi:hypothetical protein
MIDTNVGTQYTVSVESIEREDSIERRIYLTCAKK